MYALCMLWIGIEMAGLFFILWYEFDDSSCAGEAEDGAVVPTCCGCVCDPVGSDLSFDFAIGWIDAVEC